MIGASIARGYLRNGVGLGSYQPRPRQSIDQYLVQTNDFFMVGSMDGIWRLMLYVNFHFHMHKIRMDLDNEKQAKFVSLPSLLLYSHT